MSHVMLEVRGLSKSFAGVTVLHDVDLTVERGEIHGLIGPNGSGKSTLVKILAGFHRPDGEPLIRVGGTELVAPFSVADVRAAGVGFVHQDLALVGDCSAADNLGFSAAGFATARGRRIAWREHHARARRLFERVGLDVDPRTLVRDLTPAQRTLVAVARALNEFHDEALLVLDEPTAALPQHEVEILFAALRRLAADGTALVYISHRLPELIALTDRVTVLRDGRVIATRTTGEMSKDDLAVLMLGQAETERPAPAGGSSAARGAGRSALAFEAVETAALAPTTLELAEGEILVLTGSVGCGAAELGKAVYGLSRLAGGAIAIGGEPFDPGADWAAAKARGVAYLPADRQGLSSLQDLSVEENVLLTDLEPVSRRGRVVRSRARREVDRLVREYRVLPPRPDRALRTLSGGNQQKALLAKWLRLAPRVLIVDEPTQGIDIGTRGEIYARLRAAARDGLAVLWITSDFEEATVIGDRIAVFAHGRLVEILAGAAATPDVIARRSLLGEVASAA